MTRRITKHLGLLAIVVGAFMVAVPALAYTDTSPGSGASSSSSTVQPGGTVTITATFTDLAQGTTITWSYATAAVEQTEAFVTDAEAATCTVTFNPGTSTLDANHQASTQATFSSGCAGLNVVVTATGPQGQTVSTTIAVAGGFPNTSTAPVPVGWIVMGFGAILILIGILGVAWRRQRSTAPA